MNTTKKIVAVTLTAVTLGAALAPTGASARGFGGHGGHGGMGRMSFGGVHHGGHFGYGYGWRRPYYGGTYVAGYSGDCYRKWVFVPGFGPVLKTFCY